MRTITAEAIKHEPLPTESMIETEEFFHRDTKVMSFRGFDRSILNDRVIPDPRSMRGIAFMIMSMYDNIPWVSFSKKALEFGINANFEQALEAINFVFLLLEEQGFRPKPGGVTFRS